MAGVFLALDPVRGRADEANGVKARAEPDRAAAGRALTPTPFGARCSVVEAGGLRSPLLVGGLRVDLTRISTGACRWEQAAWLLGHPFAA